MKDTEIKVNRGILVDRQMETSYPGVYACGDVAEAYDFIYASNRVVPIWPNAHIGGRIAGPNMAGQNAEYDGGTAMNSLKKVGARCTEPLPTLNLSSYKYENLFAAKIHRRTRRGSLYPVPGLSNVISGSVPGASVPATLLLPKGSIPTLGRRGSPIFCAAGARR